MVRQIDIARETGLSLAAVSRALNPRGKNNNLSEETRETIRKAAERMGYTGSRLEATALRRGQTPAIRVWLPPCSNPEIGGMTQGIAHEARLCGYPLTFHFYKVGQPDYLDFIFEINQRKNTGVIFYINDQLDYEYLSQGFDEYRANGGKIVLLNNKQFDLPDITLNMDEVRGGELAAQYLMEQGCDSFFCCHSERIYCRMRSEGFSGILPKESRSVNIPYEVQGLPDPAAVARVIMESEGRKKGIFFTRRHLVNTVLFELCRAGGQIGRDIIPIRFDQALSDGVPVFACPAVVHPYEETGRLALKKLYNLLNGLEEFSETQSPSIIFE